MALSLAGNVVQSVQFGCTLTAKAPEVYSSTSGTSEENLEMESVTSRLLKAVQELESNQAGISWAKPQDSVSRSETRLLEIADACKMIAGDILHRLEKLKTKGQPSV